MTHYFEEEAVKSYTEYLELIESGEIEDVDAPQLAIEYYGMEVDARLSTMIGYIRADEANHSKVNLEYANVLR
jgi:ubiquinol oxidase